MTTAAIILGGGLGSRSVDPSRAKITQEIAGVPLLNWHLQSLQDSSLRSCVVVAGHLGDQVESTLRSIDPGPIHVQLLQEQVQKGTVAATMFAAENSDATEFLVILGDIWLSFPIDSFLDSWRSSGKEVACVVHPSTHPEDSDAVFPRHDGRVIVSPKSTTREHVPNMSSSGVFALTRHGLLRYNDETDLGSGVLAVAAAEDNLFAYVSSHYFKDTGTAPRLAAARKDAESGAFLRRGSVSPRAALFLDRDGVINPNQPEFYGPEDYRLLPGVTEQIGKANRLGVPVIVITNQPHIAKGLMTFEAHEQVRAKMDRLLADGGAFVDDYFFCPHHPEVGHAGEIQELKTSCPCRKPQPGLIQKAVSQHNVDVASSIYVGDSDRDRDLALLVGLRYIHVGSVSKLGDFFREFPESSDAIRCAIEDLLC